MHTKLFGVCTTYILVFSMFMNIAGLASFPPDTFNININFSDLVFWLPDISTSIEFSWSNIMLVILTLSLFVLVIFGGISLLGQSFDMAYITKVVVGTAVAFALGTTMIATVGASLPSWLHLFLIYIPCGLMIYSVLDIGGL